ncbi:MAG: SDR family oxidoreductase [Syntrophaceae bacterium]|nr:SDR family oxidoreductase [Syntrophaceae bacterium]
MNIFNEKVAIITGAGSGIGKGLAEELARRGAHVVISDISAERIEKVADGIAKANGKVIASMLDVSKYDAVKKNIDDTVTAHGRIDFIFNIAGIAIGGPAQDVPIDDWHKVIDINLYGVVYGSSVAFPIMMKQGFGHIVNMASIEGLVPFPNSSSYAASKHGVVGLSSALRVEGADHGVKVSVVCPGYIKTAIWNDSKMININREKLVSELPDWSGITPEQCAKVILRGVERNKAFIVVTLFAKLLWVLHRISPNLAIWIMKMVHRDARKKGIVKT